MAMSHAPAVKQSKTIKKGSKLPLDSDAKLLMLNDSDEPQEVNFKELVGGKKVVIFGLPGALLILNIGHVAKTRKHAS
jgi:hypothetical protein